MNPYDIDLMPEICPNDDSGAQLAQGGISYVYILDLILKPEIYNTELDDTQSVKLSDSVINGTSKSDLSSEQSTRLGINLM